MVHLISELSRHSLLKPCFLGSRKLSFPTVRIYQPHSGETYQCVSFSNCSRYEHWLGYLVKFRPRTTEEMGVEVSRGNLRVVRGSPEVYLRGERFGCSRLGKGTWRGKYFTWTGLRVGPPHLNVKVPSKDLDTFGMEVSGYRSTFPSLEGSLRKNRRSEG